jgi:formimidoylglutamase
MSGKRSKFCLVGIPDHQGVMNVGGRLGAARGPDAFRRVFGRLSGRDGVSDALMDLGDLHPVPRNMGESHRRAADQVRDGHSRCGLSVVVGGGHDHGFSHLLGISEALKGKRLGCLNLDAHLDVRSGKPLASSGSPFWLAIEGGVLAPDQFIEFGIQAHCNSRELWEYVGRKGVEVIEFGALRGGRAVSAFAASLKKLSSRCDIVVISFDLDSCASAFAPGVSAPQAEGFSSSEVIEMMEIAGRDPKVVSLGIFELNPDHDVDDRTARLAATAAYHFIAQALRS